MNFSNQFLANLLKNIGNTKNMIKGDWIGGSELATLSKMLEQVKGNLQSLEIFSQFISEK